MLRDWMLKEHRGYVIEKIKAPIMKALIILSNRLPEPTFENTTHPNTHVILRIWDKFLKNEDCDTRIPLFRALRKLTTDEHEHDNFERDRMQVLLELWLEEVLIGNWKPRSLDHPDSFWKDPNVRGIGYDFLVDKYYHSPEYQRRRSG